MPSETPPGQLLSSIPSSSDARRRTKLGGCASALFQIFHGKRWLPRKSLPAERLKQTISNHTEDKLPIAKLLLIADENRTGPLRDGDEVVEDKIFDKAELHEEKGPKRKPGVVARLMGLESMPSPNVMFVESKQTEPRKDAGYQIRTEPLQGDRDSSDSVVLPQQFSSQRPKPRDFKADLPTEFATSQWKKARDCSSKSQALPNILLSSCHHIDTSFPSSVKGQASNRKAMSSKRPAHRIEVAPKLLKKNHQSYESGSQRLQGSFSGAKPISLHSKCRLSNSAAGASCMKRDEVKMVQAVPQPTRNEGSQSMSIRKLQSPQQFTGRCSSHEATLVKRKHSYQRAIEQPKAVSIEKPRLDLHRQDEFSSRISQPTVCSMKKSQGAKASRHPSPPKSVQDSSGGACSSQASNCVPSSSERTAPSQLTKSCVGSNDINLRKRPSSSIRGSLLKLKRSDEFDGITKPSPMHDRVANLAHGKTMLIKSPDASRSAESEDNLYRQFDYDGSTSSAIYTESLQRSSLESSISSDPFFSEYTTSSEDCSNLSSGDSVVGHERDEEKQKDDQKTLNGIKSASFFSIMESSTESLPESLSCSIAGERASSHIEPDGNAKMFDAVCTNSGTNTAAILQELLTALSSSTAAQEKFNFSIKPEGLVSCTLDPEIEKPPTLTNVNAHCIENRLSESASQDSAFVTSSDSSQLPEENDEGEMDNSNKDCALIKELQPELGYLSVVSEMGRTSVQNGLSRDCEALMTTISKLHQIDPQVIGLKARTANNPTSEEVFSCELTYRGAVSDCLPDSDCSGKPEDQRLACSLLISTTSTADGEADSSMCRSDIESSFRSGSDEVAAWNKKLVTDCIDEAFKSLSKQMYKFSSSLSEPLSATHLLSRVYMQLDEWRGMASGMNLDAMIEKEMNLTTRNWGHIENETNNVADVVQTTIFSGLLEEVLLELL